MSWICLKEGGIYIFGIRSAFRSYKRVECDFIATRSCNRLASGSRKKKKKIVTKNLRKALFREAKKVA